MKVGLFFGSFNPIHYGHLIIGEAALNQGELHQIWLVVSPQNPLKNKQSLAPEYDRLRMVEIALQGHDRLIPSNVEFSLPRPSYTIDTLTHLRDTYRSYEFSLIMGEDNLKQLPNWKNYQAILKYYPILVYPRTGNQEETTLPKGNIRRFVAPLLDISATFIRNSIREGKSIRYLLPDAVAAYIRERSLYED